MNFSDLSYQTPIPRIITMLRYMGSMADLRIPYNRDIARALMHAAADRLMTLTTNVDPRPWRTRKDRLRDAWGVYCQRAVAIHVTSSVYDKEKAQ